MSSSLADRISDTPTTKVLSGWRRLLPIYVYKRRSGWKVNVFTLSAIIWTLGLAGSGYLAVGTTLYLNDRYRHGLGGISWTDRVYPPRWADYRIARGNAYVDQAKKSLQSGEYSRAFHQIRAGIARAPNHLEGRLLLSEMLVASGRTDLAITCLIEGVSFHHHDTHYVHRAIQLLFELREDDVVVALAREYLPHPALTPDVHRLLSFALATALYYQGRFDQAEDALRTNGADTLDVRLLAARIEWDRGFPELALALIEQLAIEYPHNPSLYRTQVQWLIADHQTDFARQTSLLRRIRFPDQAQPRIDLLYAFDRVGEIQAVAAEATALLTDFADNPAVVLQVGDFAANTGKPDLARKVREHARRHGQSLEIPSLMWVEALVVATEYDRALQIMRETLAANPEWQERLAPVFKGLQTVCFFALGEREKAHLFLNGYLGLKSLRTENLVAVANRLEYVGAEVEARHVLAHAVRVDPLNQAALTRLVEFDLDADDAPDLPVHLDRLLSMRRSPPDLLRRAYDRIGQDRFLHVKDRNALLDRLLDSLGGNRSPAPTPRAESRPPSA